MQCTIGDGIGNDKMKFTKQLEFVKHFEIPELLLKSDIFDFASSCENMPNILLETMASGLPIACSNRGPMPEVLGQAGVFFNPEQPEDIARALLELIESPQARTELARASYGRVQEYSWLRCADETFRFLVGVIQQRKKEIINV